MKFTSNTYEDPFRHDEMLIEPRDLAWRAAAPGDEIVQHVAAPGIGRHTFRVTRVDDAGTWGVLVRSTVRDLTIEEVR